MNDTDWNTYKERHFGEIVFSNIGVHLPQKIRDGDTNNDFYYMCGDFDGCRASVACPYAMEQEKSLLLEDRAGHSIMPVIMKAMDQETSLLLEDRVGHPIQIKDIGQTAVKVKIIPYIGMQRLFNSILIVSADRMYPRVQRRSLCGRFWVGVGSGAGGVGRGRLGVIPQRR